MTTVVIPTYKQWHHTHQLLLDIYNMMPKTTEIVVIDDHSLDPMVAGGLDWWRMGLLGERLYVIRNDENMGFLKSSNLGVSKARCKNVILMNNDVRIRDKDLDDKVEKALDECTVPILAGINVYLNSTGWNERGGKIYPYVGGWFMAFKKEEWDKFGGFDERYIPYDFEDVDLSTTYLANGGKLVTLEANISHIGAQSYTYSPAREEQTKKNQKKFFEKWPQVKEEAADG